MDMQDRIAAALGREVAGVERLSGGSLSEVAVVRFADGGEAVAKRGGPVEVEARMLRAIAATGCRAPEVLHAGGDLLVMSRLAGGSPSQDGWREAGANVARLHAETGARYGWPEDTAFGEASCPAGPCDDWPGFWAERRLMAWPEALPSDVARQVERLATRLTELLPEAPRPALLHGDLWSGNLMFDATFSGLIDPACYHGHAEVDLAMLTLFGNPPEPFFDGYGRLEDGWQERRPLYQLWPALVHLRLFGASYRGMVERLLAAYQ